MVRSVLVLAVVALLVSCEPGGQKSSDPKPSDSGPIKTPPITPPSTSRIGTSDLKDAANQVKSASESAAVEIKKTAGSLEEGVAGLGEAAAAIDPAYSVEKLKAATATLSLESLKGVGDKILAAIQDKDGLVQKVQEQIENLGVADAAKIGELKGSLESAVADLKALKEKLAVVVDKLKASGADVSKYTAAISG